MDNDLSLENIRFLQLVGQEVPQDEVLTVSISVPDAQTPTPTPTADSEESPNGNTVTN